MQMHSVNPNVATGNVTKAENADYEKEFRKNIQPNSVNNYQVNNQGVGTYIQSDYDFDLYSNDIANFERLGKNMYEALDRTSDAANRIKVEYMQFKHDFPDTPLRFEPMPNPNNYGKGKKGFITYCEKLENWENTAKTQIVIARSTGNQKIIEANNANTALLAGLTVALSEELKNRIDETTVAVLQEVQNGTAKVVETIKNVEGNIEKTIKNSENKLFKLIFNTAGVLLNVIQCEGKKTRNNADKHAEDINENIDRSRRANHEEHEETRGVVKRQTQEAEVLNSMRASLSDMLTHEHFEDAFRNKTVEWLGKAADKVMADTELSFDRKKSALRELTRMVKEEKVISEEDKKAFEDRYFRDIHEHRTI